MKKLIKQILTHINISVYVVVAYDSQRSKIRECRVYLNHEDAGRDYEALMKVYTGNDSVELYSRSILPQFTA